MTLITSLLIYPFPSHIKNYFTLPEGLYQLVSEPLNALHLKASC